MDLVTFNFVAAWTLSAVGIVFLFLVVGYKELLVYIRDPENHFIPCIMLFLWAFSLYMESVNGWEEGESYYIFSFTSSIVTIPLYYNFLQMRFPEESPDWLYYYFGWSSLIILGVFVISEITNYVMEIYGFPTQSTSIFDFLGEMDEESLLLLLPTMLLTASIFIYYLVKLAPVRALKQRKEKRETEEKVEQEKRLQREAKEKKRTQNRALWSRKKEAMRTIAKNVFPKIISFEYDPDTDRLVIKTDEQKLHYNNALKRNLEDIRKEMQNDYEHRGLSRTSYVSNYGRSRRYGYSTDDDINSVDGGPPSEAYAQAWGDNSDDDDG